MPGSSIATAPRAYLRTPDDAHGFWQLGNLWRVTATGHQTGGSLSFIDQLVTDDARRVRSRSARMLQLVTPSGFERLLRIVEERTEALTLTAPVPAVKVFEADRRQRLCDEIGLRPIAVADLFT